jgi:MFS family permease
VVRPINANFTRLFYGLAISAVGDYVFDTTLILWITTKLVAGKSYAPAAVSGVLVAVSVGIIAIAPAAGVFVDRWDKRRTMLGSDLIRAALVGVLVVVALLPANALPVGVTLGLIYFVVFASTGVANFFAPANFTLIGDIVHGDAERAKAASLIQSARYTAAIVGPPLAAPLLFTTGVFWALIINALSFLVSFVMVRGIKVPAAAPAVTETAVAEPVSPVEVADIVQIRPTVEEEVTALAAEKPSFLREFADGIRFIAKTRALRVLLIVLTVATLGTGALNALDVFFVTDNLHADAGLYGMLGMGEGIGAIVGTLFAAWICRKLGDVRVFYLGIIVIGAGLLVYSRLGSLYLAVAVLALLGLPLGGINVAMTPIVLRVVPRDLLGRTVSVIGPIQSVAGMVSVLAAGWLVSTVMLDFHASVGGIEFGRIDTVFVAGGLLIALGGLYAMVGLRGAVPPPAAAPGPAVEEPARA